MSTAQGFRIQRLTLAANTLTSVWPPFADARQVLIGASSTDVVIHTNDDLSEYRVVTQGYERESRVRPFLFTSAVPAFWLLSVAGGLVILEWN